MNITIPPELLAFLNQLLQTAIQSLIQGILKLIEDYFKTHGLAGLFQGIQLAPPTP